MFQYFCPWCDKVIRFISGYKHNIFVSAWRLNGIVSIKRQKLIRTTLKEMDSAGPIQTPKRAEWTTSVSRRTISLAKLCFARATFIIIEFLESEPLSERASGALHHAAWHLGLHLLRVRSCRARYKLSETQRIIAQWCCCRLGARCIINIPAWGATAANVSR